MLGLALSLFLRYAAHCKFALAALSLFLCLSASLPLSFWSCHPLLAEPSSSSLRLAPPLPSLPPSSVFPSRLLFPLIPNPTSLFLFLSDLDPSSLSSFRSRLPPSARHRRHPSYRLSSWFSVSSTFFSLFSLATSPSFAADFRLLTCLFFLCALLASVKSRHSPISRSKKEQNNSPKKKPLARLHSAIFHTRPLRSHSASILPSTLPLRPRLITSSAHSSTISPLFDKGIRSQQASL